jgi:hypothetical protein
VWDLATRVQLLDLPGFTARFHDAARASLVAIGPASIVESPRPDATSGVNTPMRTVPIISGAGIVAGALPGAVLGTIVDAEQGTFRDFKSQPAKGCLLQAPTSLAQAPARTLVP